MAMVYTSLAMMNDMMAFLKKAKETVRVISIMLMEVFILESGWKIKKMVKVQ